MNTITNADVCMTGDIVTISLNDGCRLVARVGLTECEASAMPSLEVSEEWKDNNIVSVR